MVTDRLPFMATCHRQVYQYGNKNPITRPTTIAGPHKGGGPNQQNKFTHTRRTGSVARGKLGRKVKIVTIKEEDNGRIIEERKVGSDKN